MCQSNLTRGHSDKQQGASNFFFSSSNIHRTLRERKSLRTGSGLCLWMSVLAPQHTPPGFHGCNYNFTKGP
ncbi:unnamed protein product [Knipowitschia caucasica]